MCLDVYRDSRFINGSALSLHRTSDAEDCKMILVFFVQVVKSLLDFKDEQLSVQMDAHDTLWGETGTFLLFHSDEFNFCTTSFCRSM